MEILLIASVVIPIFFGVLCSTLFSKSRFLQETISVVISILAVGIAFGLFLQSSILWPLNHVSLLKLDGLSRLVLLFANLFGFLIIVYSLKYLNHQTKVGIYYGAMLISIGLANGVILANHLLVLLVFWSVLGITLYLLIMTGSRDASKAAKKSLIIIGGSDALLLLGMVLIYQIMSSLQMHEIQIPLQSGTSYLIFVCFALSAFAKAGAMPLHTWIPDVADKAPISITAFLPAALDKLLGIYLLARMSLDWFILSEWARLFLLIVGAITILAAVMMALIQHDMKRLLAYHAVSQVGYMVLGIGTGNPLGIAGGLFHMLNHSLYKSCLFLTAGAVQHRTGTTRLDKLGGLGRKMPITFVCFLIAAFAISGIPPFNGFASKWMIYQGLIQLGQSGHSLWIVWMVAAMFGSGLTLASFMKLTHSVFLGVPHPKQESVVIKDTGFCMTMPMVVLAGLCVVFGVFALQVPVRVFLSPIIPDIKMIGLWSSGFATMMIFLGIFFGVIFYLWTISKHIRQADPFIGGETLPQEIRITGLGFYETIRSMKGIQRLYQWAEGYWFDCYEQGAHFAGIVSRRLRKCHTGYLNLYILWILMGVVALMFVLTI